MLLSTSDPKYLRRLSRAITATAQRHGAYWNQNKVARAYFSKGRVWLKIVGDGNHRSLYPDADTLVDGYGRTISASREP